MTAYTERYARRKKEWENRSSNVYGKGMCSVRHKLVKTDCPAIMHCVLCHTDIWVRNKDNKKLCGVM